MSRERVVLGLSGGVDSAVAARLLSTNYDVTCAFLNIGPCSSGEDDARAVAEGLKLGFVSVDISSELERSVCTPFAADYLAGRTPLPCARCNPSVKFPALISVADQIGARFVATGHYAQRGTDESGRALLLRGQPSNDQSYMLSRLPQELMRRILFPLGQYEKRQVRAMAGEFGLHVAEKPDSMEICFIPGGDYASWLDARGSTPPPGDFVDQQGNLLGRHKGIHHYTLGQRRGLGIPSASGRLFVSKIDPVRNRVVLSDGADLFTDTARCMEPNWISIPALTGPMEVTVRLRHSKTETPATISPDGPGVLVKMAQPARAPTPGQLAVFYQGEAVVGSAWIY